MAERDSHYSNDFSFSAVERQLVAAVLNNTKFDLRL